MDIDLAMGPLPVRMLHLLYGVLLLVATAALGMLLRVVRLDVDEEKRRRLHLGFVALALVFGIVSVQLGRYLVQSGYNASVFMTMIVFGVLGLVLGLAAGKVMDKYV